jgi:hypothetical protein
MSSTNWITVIGGAIITILPTITSVIPSPYNELASAIAAALVASFHLYQPAPSSTPSASK